MLILKSIFYVFIIYLVSFSIEKLTGLKLLIDNFLWKKSKNMAIGATINNTIFIFLLTNIIVLLVSDKKLEDHEIVEWIIFIPILTLLFAATYYSLTGIDPSKKDDDFA